MNCKKSEFEKAIEMGLQHKAFGQRGALLYYLYIADFHKEYRIESGPIATFDLRYLHDYEDRKIVVQSIHQDKGTLSKSKLLKPIHVAAVRNGKTKGFSLFVNGEFIGKQAYITTRKESSHFEFCGNLRQGSLF